MGDRVKKRIDELGEVVGGATPSTKVAAYWDGDIPWIGPKDLSDYQGRYISHGHRNISQIGLDSCSAKLLPKGTILFSSRAPIGYVAIAANPICTNQGFKSIIPNHNIDAVFLYYLLKANAEKIKALGTGTTFKEVSGTVMKSIEVEIPVSIDEQRQIALVLGALDDKIALNTRMNGCLEELARVFFEKWLSEPHDTLLPISDIAEINPETYSPKEDWQTIQYLDTGAVTSNLFSIPVTIDTTTEKLPSRARRKVKTGDVLYSTVRPANRHYGIVINPPENLLVSTGFCVLRDTCGLGGPFLYLLLTQDSITETLNNIAEQSTSAYPSIRPGAIGSLLVPIPNASKVETLINHLDCIFTLIAKNQNESIKLAALRDALLPKLMSGEIDVSKVDVPASARS